MNHTPVLLHEVLLLLDLASGDNIIDATVGQGGHARAILQRTSPSGVLFALDRDASQLSLLRTSLHEFSDRVHFVEGSFARLSDLLIESRLSLSWQGILFDLGWSSTQLSSGKGFSFMRDEELDMRYDASQRLTAKEVVNTWSQSRLEETLSTYGEERYASRIAGAIVRARKSAGIYSTSQLSGIVLSALPRGYKRGRIHPATRTFQALRIVVNDEFAHIEAGLRCARDILAPKGKIVVISFHSGEDRIVKRMFQTFEREGVGHRMQKKPIIASEQEITHNPRARSAKLRSFKLSES